MSNIFENKKLVRCSTVFRIDLTFEAMNLLSDTESYFWDGPLLDNDLFSNVDGVSDLDFNSEKGPCLYITIDTEFDNASTHSEILGLVETQLGEIEEHLDQRKEEEEAEAEENGEFDD